MKHGFWFVLGLWMTTACVQHVTPVVTPQKIPPVSPPIRARALLLITPSFEGYLSREKNYSSHQVFRYGEAGTKALSALVTESFTVVEIRRVAAADVQRLMAGPADTSVADILLAPAFEGGGARLRMIAGDPIYIPAPVVDSMQVSNVYTTEITASVTLRLDARSFPTGSSFTWMTVGGTGPVLTSLGRASGLALEIALHAISDSLAAHRKELELGTPSVPNKERP